jgi:hypothetical protein
MVSESAADIGNGIDARAVYVAYSQSRNQIIVGHEGTDPSEILSVENDIHFSPTPLLTVLNVAGTPEGVEVHNGFQVRAYNRSTAMQTQLTSRRRPGSKRAPLFLVL